MKNTDVRAGSILSFSQSAHVLSTRPYASILGTKSCSDQYFESGLLQNQSKKATFLACDSTRYSNEDAFFTEMTLALTGL
jgi:hypothetical protein